MSYRKVDFHLDVMVTGALEIGNILVRFIISVMLARALGPEGRGVYALALAAPGLLLSFTGIGIGEATTVLIGKQRFPKERIIGSTNALLLIMTAVGFAVYFGFSGLILSTMRQSMPAHLYFLSFFIFPLTLYWGGNASAALGLALVRKVSWGRFLNNFLFMAFVIVLAKAGVTVERTVLAFIAAALVENVYVFYFIRRESSIGVCFDLEVIKAQLAIGWNFFWGGLFMQVTKRLDVFIVNYFAGATPLGIYTVAFSVAEFVLTIPAVYSRVAFSSSAVAREEDGFEVSHAAIRQTLFLMIVFAVVLMLPLKYIIVWIYGATFLPALTPAYILMPGVIMLGLGTLLGVIFTGYGRAREITRAAAISCVATIVLDIVLIPAYGITGAAAASTAAYSLSTLYFVWKYIDFTKVGVADMLLIKRRDFEVYWNRAAQIFAD